MRLSFLAAIWQGTLLGVLVAALSAPAARADEPRLSISGYDPVAYFTQGKPAQGKAEHEYVWRKLRWRFATAEHRDLFVKEPNRYAPQYDGYCAMGAADGSGAHKDTVDPEAWAIVDGKLYLVHTRYWLERWREKAEEYIKRANADWQVIANLPDPVVVGSPCPATLSLMSDSRCRRPRRSILRKPSSCNRWCPPCCCVDARGNSMPVSSNRRSPGPSSFWPTTRCWEEQSCRGWHCLKWRASQRVGTSEKNGQRSRCG